MADNKENKANKEKKEKEKKQEEKQKGIPIDNKHVSSDPNKSPHGAEKDKHVDHHHEDYVEPYNRQTYEEDPKRNRR